MRKASIWVTLAALLGGLSCVFWFGRPEHAAFSYSGQQMVVVPPRMNVVWPPTPNVVLPPVPHVVAQVQVTAVPVGDNNIPSGKATYNGDARNPVWKIEGKWESTTEDARHSAYLQAREELVSYLRSQDPPIAWVPPLSFVSDRNSGRRSLVGKPEEETRDFPGLGTMRRYVLEMTLTTEARREIWQHECELHARQRMLFLGKILAGLVSVLAAVAGYLRLDELTRGYYTGWLRLAAAGARGVAAVLIALLA